MTVISSKHKVKVSDTKYEIFTILIKNAGLRATFIEIC